MSRSSSSSNNISRSSNYRQNEYLVCYCGIKVSQRIAHIEDNEGHRFFGCQNYEACRFFCWYDPEIPAYSQNTINQLKTELHKIQASMDIQTSQHRLEIDSERHKRKLEKTSSL